MAVDNGGTPLLSIVSMVIAYLVIQVWLLLSSSLASCVFVLHNHNAIVIQHDVHVYYPDCAPAAYNHSGKYTSIIILYDYCNMIADDVDCLLTIVDLFLLYLVALAAPSPCQRHLLLPLLHRIDDTKFFLVS